MKYKGTFNYFLDNESKTYNEIIHLVNTDMTVSVFGLDVYYISPKKEYTITDKIQELLQKAKSHQNQNGGILEGMEFPFDGANIGRKIAEQKFKEETKNYSGTIGIEEITKIVTDEREGIKDTVGKLHYELSWEFIEEMAKRMANNKSDKYPLYNWKKLMDIQNLKDAINRHHVEVMKGNHKDGEEELGHIISYACNAMMLWEQLKNK